ncbi:MAG: ATP-dependent DNA ligase [Candidatus Bathyarchaeota archaeon]|nr:ATP-dependent DNA ligase [Candidatus Bathyarchaeota archaeon]
MNYSIIANAYEKIEATSKRLEMIDLLVDLLKNTPKQIIEKVIYLTQGKICPDFIGLEVGIAEKLAIKALSRASGQNQKQIENNLQKSGDIGETTYKFISEKIQSTFFQRTLSVEQVHDTFTKMAKTNGAGAIGIKMSLLAGLLSDASPKEAKYLIRTITRNLRLGIADMTVLDALAISYGGGKENRPIIERAYNISSDLGKVAKIVVEKGIEGVKQIQVEVFEPIRPMLAERLSSSEEILDKLNGICAAEYKYDGERIQAHKKGNQIALFSRRLEKISNQYPDVINFIKTKINAKDAILEGEVVAIDNQTGELLPFQELMHRRRKYGVHHFMEQYPVSLFLFEALYVDGEDLTTEKYPIRRKTLENIIIKNDRVKPTKKLVTKNAKELELFFEEAIANGSEGLICKAVGKESIYQAGARGWLWIKYKRDYQSEMIDTTDLVIIGAFYGRGKRVGAYGTLLLATYNKDTDTFESVTKCGTGFTDDDLKKIPKILKKHLIQKKHSRVSSTINADIWFEPQVVLEIIGAEITLSPIHTCGLNSIRQNRGLAIRFPRFTGKYRTEKNAEDATTSKEIIKMYQSQLKQISVDQSTNKAKI